MRAPALLVMARHRGTEFSNPFPSSGESANFRFRGRRRERRGEWLARRLCVYLLYMSLHKWSLIGYAAPAFVGIGNLTGLIGDQRFIDSLLRTTALCPKPARVGLVGRSGAGQPRGGRLDRT
jgi:hypothetical protein